VDGKVEFFAPPVVILAKGFESVKSLGLPASVRTCC